MSIRIVCGVTTVASRFDGTLQTALESIANGGFPKPSIFVDGCSDVNRYTPLGDLVSGRYPPHGCVGNWVTGLWSLFIHNRSADVYVMFQDDIIMSRNVCQYLQRTPPDSKSYFNLYTVPSAEGAKPDNMTHGWYRPVEHGQGALGLAFNNEVVRKILTNQRVVDKVSSAGNPKTNLDGMLCDMLMDQGIQEYVHFPSIVQHNGHVSTLGTRPRPTPNSFRGMDFDFMELLC